MEGSKRKLIVLLCMHRSGSSLTANLLQQLGMSLGPFELIAAAPSNPYGHFEALPFHIMNRRVQEWAFGFADDVPTDPTVLSRFLETHAAWPTDRHLPEEWVDEGEAAIRALIQSGPVSGFKDPRTPLIWPYWERVFERIDDVEVVAANLLRSPHEIAMSLCSRSKGSMPYWTALDVVGVHLDRMKAAADEGCVQHVVRFGTPSFWDDMKTLAEACGLVWDEATARRVYDPTCVHHKPAAVAHRAQAVLNELGQNAWSDFDPVDNALRLSADARKYEAAMHGQLNSTRTELGKSVVSVQQYQESEARAETLQHELDVARLAIAEGEKGFQIASTCLEQSEKHLARVTESLVSNQERRVQAEQLLAHTQGILAHTEQALQGAQARLAEANERQAKLVADFQQVFASMQADRDRIAALQRDLDEQRTASISKDKQLVRSMEREEKRWLENVALQRKLERFEQNAIIGAAVKGRRQIKQIWLKFRHMGPNGEPRSTRVDRPM